MPETKVKNDLAVTGDLDVTGDQTVGGDVQITGNLTVTGDVTAGSVEATGGALVADATIVVGAEAGDDVAITIQLKDASGDDIAVEAMVYAYLSDDSAGAGVVATAPDGGIAIGTDGDIIPIVANKVFFLRSEDDGDIDLVCTESGTDTFYLVLVLPSGKSVVSDAITHAA